MKYNNVYLTDKNSIRREVMEFLIIGSKYGKIFNLIGILFIISSFIYMNNNSNYSIYFFVALLLFVINIVRIYKKAVYFSKKLEDKTLKRVITIDDFAISEKVYDSEKIIKDVSFQINEVDYVGNGIKNIFIVLSGDLLVIRKDNFIEGDAVSFYKELISKKKTDISSKENFSKFHFQKICIIVGAIFSTILSLIFIKRIELDEPAISIFFKMLLSGMLFSIWISFAITFYVKWYVKQNKMIKILSIVVFPISFFVFMCIGLIKAVPYIVASSIFDKTCDNE